MPASYNRSYINVNNRSCFTTDKCGCIFGKMKFNERLKWARSEAKLSQQELVDLLPKKPDGSAMMSQANLAKMEGNPNTVGSNYSYYIAKACGISPEWLINETGDPYDVNVTYQQNEPALKVHEVMQSADKQTQYQIARLVNTYTEPTENKNGNHNIQ